MTRWKNRSSRAVCGRSFPVPGQENPFRSWRDRIVTEWLPTSGYEFAEGSDIEVYFQPDPQNTTYEVWIPVTEKAGVTVFVNWVMVLLTKEMSERIL